MKQKKYQMNDDRMKKISFKHCVVMYMTADEKKRPKS